jgi:hypothetical protein
MPKIPLPAVPQSQLRLVQHSFDGQGVVEVWWAGDCVGRIYPRGGRAGFHFVTHLHVERALNMPLDMIPQPFRQMAENVNVVDVVVDPDRLKE